MPSDARAKMLIKFRDDNPRKFINYLRKLETYAGELRVAFEECEPDAVFAKILMKYVKLMADTPEMVDIDHEARVLLNDRILFLRRMFDVSQKLEEQELLRRLVKQIVRARGTTGYAQVAY